MSGRFNASVLFGHQTLLANVMGRVQASGGTVMALTPAEFAGMSDLAGALNYWAAQAAPSLPHQVQAEIPYGDFGRRVFAASKEVVMAFPFRTPAGPFTGPNGSLIRMSVSENPSIGGDPWLRKLAISATPGDMGGLLPASQGKEAMLAGLIGVDLPADALLYANTIITEDAPDGTTGSGFSIVWPQV